MSAKEDADKAKPGYPWTARQKRRKECARQERKKQRKRNRK